MQIRNIIAVLVLSASAFAQGGFYQDRAEGRLINGNALVAIPGAAVTVCSDQACVSPVNIYSNADLAIGHLIGTSTTADANGNFSFYVLPGQYFCQVAASGFSTAINPCQVSGANVLTAYSLNNIVYVDGVKYACSGAGISAAINALPSTGGTIDARGCLGSITSAATVLIGTTTQAVMLVLGGTNITFTNTSGDGFVVNGFGSGIIGQGPLNTIISAGGGFTGTLIRAEPLTGSNSISGVTISGMRLELAAAPTSIGMKLLSVRNPSDISNIEIRNGTGTAVLVDTSTVPAAGLSQGIDFRSIYIQVATPKTADTFVLRGNQVYLGPNVQIISPSVEGTFRGLAIDSGTTGLGRGNSFVAGAIQGYNPCLDIFGTAATSTAPQGNLISGISFENCTNAVKITGADGSNQASHNVITGNFYLNPTVPLVKMDFATQNTWAENITGGAGGVVLTANSSANIVNVYYSTGPSDVTDSGTVNIVSGKINLSGIGSHIMQGQVEILRANTGAVQWLFADNGSLQMAGKLWVSPTAPTIASGFGTSPSIVNSNGSAAFEVNVGTGGAATSGVLTMPTATNGWSCSVFDMNTNIVTRETAFTTTSLTLTAASAWTASDKLLVNCGAF